MFCFFFSTPNQAYLMMVPSFRHTYVQPSRLSYQYEQQYAQPSVSPVTPTVSYAQQHSVAEQETAVLQAPISTLPPQYTTIQQSYQPHTTYQAPAHVQIQQSIEYPARQTIEYTHSSKGSPLHTHATPIQYSPPSTQLYQSHQHPPPSYAPSYSSNTPTLDFFGKSNKHQTSLLDSYIPSSVILEKQRALKLHLQQSLSHHDTSNSYPHSAYNTIAYSAPLNHYSFSHLNHLKRSPKLPVQNAPAAVVANKPPLHLIKQHTTSAATTSTTIPTKSTKLTKV